jgi:hypothetical protein
MNNLPPIENVNQQDMDLQKLEQLEQKRQIRINVKNAYLTASLTELQQALENATQKGNHEEALNLQNMIDECHRHNVDNYGNTPL